MTEKSFTFSVIWQKNCLDTFEQSWDFYGHLNFFLTFDEKLSFN